MSNKLAQEKSPYLLQHKDNPVDWYPWSDEAFEKAKKEQKPIFLSIGYAPCHWCHVMEHESFEDSEIASMMNQAFVNIKVDREERPDLDQMYMTVCQMLNGQGGWPLTIIMTPEKEPFFAGTYIPKEARYNRIGLRQLIPGITGVWKNEPAKITKAIEKIREGYSRSQQFESGVFPGTEAIDFAAEQLQQNYDADYGGFGSAPKFPTPHNLMFLFRQWHYSKDERFKRSASETLTAMRLGGIWDQVGYGFHRYSTDREWLLPHFEKMLYDQALMMMAYTEGWQATQNPLFKQTVYEIAEYVNRDLRSEAGYFYSAEDADSEGEEGKFYTWSHAELTSSLPEEEMEFLEEYFNISKEGNFNDEATGAPTGQNILWLDIPLGSAETSRWHAIRATLTSVRNTRIRPLLDDKMLTDWNALMISALARSGAVFDESDFIQSAEKAYQFVLHTMLENEVLYHRYRDDERAIHAFADDYAFLIQASIDLYEATFNSEYLKQAVALNDHFIDRFYDAEVGGFYSSSDEADLVLGAQKPVFDGAVPSANSMALVNLLRLGKITGNTHYDELVEQTGKLFSSELIRSGSSITMGMMALQFIHHSPKEIIVAENAASQSSAEIIRYLRSAYLPQKVLVHNPGVEKDPIFTLCNYLTHNPALNDDTTIYVCRNYSCEKPVNSLSALKELL